MTDTTNAIRVHQYGGPEVLRMDEIPLPEPGPGEVRLRHTAVGVNYADIHTRNGRYPLPELPSCLGSEGTGVVEAVGDRVDFVSVGDRVTYSSGGHALPRGSYCEARTMRADRLIALPDDIDDATAAAMTTKGITAHYLVNDVYPVGPGVTIAVHAAAGGVGQILCQWANHLGARVIGIVGSEAKEQHAINAGCHHTLVRGRDDIVAAVKSLTAGEGVPVVFDAVGADTFEESLHCLRPRGLLASYGTASGPIPPFDIFRLNHMGSLYVTSAAYLWHVRNREEMIDRAQDLIDVVSRGIIKIPVERKYPLSDVADAHRDMESRATTGMSVLII